MWAIRWWSKILTYFYMCKVLTAVNSYLSSVSKVNILCATLFQIVFVKNLLLCDYIHGKLYNQKRLTNASWVQNNLFSHDTNFPKPSTFCACYWNLPKPSTFCACYWISPARSVSHIWVACSWDDRWTATTLASLHYETLSLNQQGLSRQPLQPHKSHIKLGFFQ